MFLPRVLSLSFDCYFLLFCFRRLGNGGNVRAFFVRDNRRFFCFIWCGLRGRWGGNPAPTSPSFTFWWHAKTVNVWKLFERNLYISGSRGTKTRTNRDTWDVRANVAQFYFLATYSRNCRSLFAIYSYLYRKFVALWLAETKLRWVCEWFATGSRHMRWLCDCFARSFVA